MAFKTKNKKASIDSAFVWIIAFLVIAFILIITNVFVFSLFVIKGGSEANVVFEKSDDNLILNKKFLSFLNTKIIVNNKEEKIIDSIRSEKIDENEINKIIEELNKICDINDDKKYFLKTPGGIITSNGIGTTGPRDRYYTEGRNERYVESYIDRYYEITHKTIVNKELVEIKLSILKECL